jgi:hypothetical protein
VLGLGLAALLTIVGGRGGQPPAPRCCKGERVVPVYEWFIFEPAIRGDTLVVRIDVLGETGAFCATFGEARVEDLVTGRRDLDRLLAGWEDCGV